MKIEELKQQIIKEVGKDPFADPTSWVLIEKRFKEDIWPVLLDRSGAAKFLELLPTIFPAEKFVRDSEAQVCWERIGNFYKNQGRLHEALSIYRSLYEQLLESQEKSGKRVRKGTPFVWMSDCYAAMGFPVLAKRCLMLALCENAIHERGAVPPDTTGTYWRLVYRHGLSDAEVKRYGKQAFKLSEDNKEEALFPEWVVQEFDNNWMSEIPSPNEAGIYFTNTRYIKKLISKLGDGTGQALERLTEYILSCMPGCRTTRRKRTESTTT